MNELLCYLPNIIVLGVLIEEFDDLISFRIQNGVIQRHVIKA